MSEKINITNLSPHLFWDVNRDRLDLEKNKELIIQRTLDYGLMSDWRMIREYYGIDKIAKTAMTIRDLDTRSASFVAILSGIPIEKFLCYTTKQSMPQHWDF
jgi:hypothetical protein